MITGRNVFPFLNLKFCLLEIFTSKIKKKPSLISQVIFDKIDDDDFDYSLTQDKIERLC